jgi:threonine/homoserine/homoserine lactone efflux protein
MISPIPPWPLFSTFLIASLTLAVTPGPGVLYVVTRSVVQGRFSGIVSVAGVAFGNFGNALAASIGLAALFAVSSVAFSLIKYGGALYLIFVGVRMILAPPAEASPTVERTPPRRLFRDGFVVALLNPKTTIFYAAFLPQFFSPGADPMYQSVVLSSIFVGIAAITDSAYVAVAGAVAPTVRASRTRRLGMRFGGGVFIALGAFTALSGSRGAK